MNDTDVRIKFDTKSADDYRRFLRVKSLPRYRFQGRTASIPAEYAGLVGEAPASPRPDGYRPLPSLFDYQRDIAALAIRKRKFAVFAACGLGKSLVLLEYARHCAAVLPPHQCVLIVSPLMVVRQTIAECRRFYGDSLHVRQVRAADLPAWTESGGDRIGITNYEAVTDAVTRGRVGAIVLDESSMLKSHYGTWARRLVEMGRGLDWKLCLTGTPAPNDRIEYANHAVFLDQFPNVNAFLARYFVNRGQTQNRWELKPHALRPFYRSLSHWCVFLEDPATYGWKDNVGNIPPINVHVHDVSLTREQAELVCQLGGDMFGTPGGITSRARLSQLAKGRAVVGGKTLDVASDKVRFIRKLVRGWEDEESTIVWCLYNHEQEAVAAAFPGCANVSGSTPEEERMRLVEDFQAGRRRVLVTKGKILGFGLNLQIATRQVFSGLVDSYEQFHQCVKRSNRIGSSRPLNVHVPVTPLELPMVETVLRKAARVGADTREQEQIFKESSRAE